MDPCCARFVAPLPVLSPSLPHAHVGICQAARRRRPPSAEVGGVLVWPLFSAGLHCRGIEVRALLSDLERGYWSAVCTGARVVCDHVHFLRPVNYGSECTPCCCLDAWACVGPYTRHPRAPDISYTRGGAWCPGARLRLRGSPHNGRVVRVYVLVAYWIALMEARVRLYGGKGVCACFI